MDFDELEDQMEQMGMAITPGYDLLGNSLTAWSKIGPTNSSEGGVSTTPRKVGFAIEYCECLKNHVMNIGGQAVDFSKRIGWRIQKHDEGCKRG